MESYFIATLLDGNGTIQAKQKRRQKSIFSSLDSSSDDSSTSDDSIERKNSNEVKCQLTN